MENSDNLLKNRYSIIDRLGRGSSGITYTALDTKSELKVAIKALSLSGLNDWKKIDLFAREAKILQQLNHHAIPQYLDYFQVETEDNIYFYIVQQLAPGQSLATLIKEGWQPNENTVKEIAKQILGILIYLQELNPPVIHRDIKPQNIIYQPDTGKLFLVDFGAVQDTYHNTVIGSTVVGTYGYMSPEQYRGGAVLSTDLYGLGCTLLFLLTGNSPAELPQRKLKIKFRSAVKIKREFANWIEKLIEPDINDRIEKALDALAILQGAKSVKDYRKLSKSKPPYSSIRINNRLDKTIVTIPPLLSHKRKERTVYLFLFWNILLLVSNWIIGMSMSWLGFFYSVIFLFEIFLPNKILFFTLIPRGVFWLNICVISPFLFNSNFLIFGIALLPHILDFLHNPSGYQKLRREFFFETQVEVNSFEITIKRGLDSCGTVEKIAAWQVHELMKMNWCWCKIELEDKEAKKEYQFGYLLTPAEKAWLETEIIKRIASGNRRNFSRDFFV